jgi:hypothetical protein
MGNLYPMYRTKAPNPIAVTATTAAHVAGAGGLDRLAAPVDGVPGAAEGIEALPFRAARRFPVARVVVERVAVVGDLLGAVRARRRREGAAVDAVCPTR